MSDLLQLMIVLVIVLVAAKGSCIVSSAVGQPAVLGELLAGVILGPSVINLFSATFLDSPYLEVTARLPAFCQPTFCPWCVTSSERVSAATPG